MGALGVAVKELVESLIDDDNLKSSATVSEIRFVEGAYGGYSEGSRIQEATTVVNCIPSNYIQTRTGLLRFGDLQDGELRVLVKADVSIDAKDDEVLFQSENYKVREIKPVFFNEETIAKGIILVKDLTAAAESTDPGFPFILQ